MTGQCYHTTDKCDKLQWCKYGLADYIAVCQGPVDEGFQKCKDGYHWYPIKQACNYHNWCTDKTDEDPDMCKAFLCPEGTVKCNDGRHCGVNQSRCDYAKEMANK
ncbi:low-density lipoprotein receptor-related protein-like [Mytilus trossulus]|uniref:low-density lipoprotein receptor-related protein-like n=1 Tax=Mytilus trossulus TaxID=6551 RepID=UPI00300699AE